jgi:hypothetical protein
MTRVTVEFVKIGAPAPRSRVPYDVIVDRISHEVPMYRSYLKHAVLAGRRSSTTRSCGPPTTSSSARRWSKLGVASPKTVVLPNKQYVPGIKHDESLREPRVPARLEGHRRAHRAAVHPQGRARRRLADVYVCRSLEELIHHYDQSGMLTMIVQEFIEWEHFVRCMCLGQEEILPMKYDPRCGSTSSSTTPEPRSVARIVKDARTIVKALGYDMNSIEFAVRDGVPYAIDFMNPAPDMDINSLTPGVLPSGWSHMADMVDRWPGSRRKQAKELKWSTAFTRRVARD